MKVSKFLFIIVFIACCFSLFAQYEYPGAEDEEQKNDKNRNGYYNSKFFVGGNLGLSFGTYTYIELNPIVGYKVTPRLSLGLGPKYMYYKYKGYYETSSYGGKVFAMFTVFKDLEKSINIRMGDIFIYGENETINFEPYTFDYLGNLYTLDRAWYNVTLLGGGMRIPLGIRGGLSIIVLWDVTQNPEYRYSNPEIRLSFDF